MSEQTSPTPLGRRLVARALTAGVISPAFSRLRVQRLRNGGAGPPLARQILGRLAGHESWPDLPSFAWANRGREGRAEGALPLAQAEAVSRPPEPTAQAPTGPPAMPARPLVRARLRTPATDASTSQPWQPPSQRSVDATAPSLPVFTPASGSITPLSRRAAADPSRPAALPLVRGIDARKQDTARPRTIAQPRSQPPGRAFASLAQNRPAASEPADEATAFPGETAMAARGSQIDPAGHQARLPLVRAATVPAAGQPEEASRPQLRLPNPFTRQPVALAGGVLARSPVSSPQPLQSGTVNPAPATVPARSLPHTTEQPPLAAATAGMAPPSSLPLTHDEQGRHGVVAPAILPRASAAFGSLPLSRPGTADRVQRLGLPAAPFTLPLAAPRARLDRQPASARPAAGPAESANRERAPSALPAAAPATASLDLERLADRVYELLQRRIRIEMESLGL